MQKQIEKSNFSSLLSVIRVTPALLPTCFLLIEAWEIMWEFLISWEFYGNFCYENRDVMNIYIIIIWGNIIHEPLHNTTSLDLRL